MKRILFYNWNYGNLKNVLTSLILYARALQPLGQCFTNHTSQTWYFLSIWLWCINVSLCPQAVCACVGVCVCIQYVGLCQACLFWLENTNRFIPSCLCVTDSYRNDLRLHERSAQLVLWTSTFKPAASTDGGAKQVQPCPLWARSHSFALLWFYWKFVLLIAKSVTN